MKAIPWPVKAGLLVLLTVLMAVPPGSLTALAKQEGPQKAPEQKDQKKPEYSISVESSLVNVDVVVTDQDGNILSGLTKQNFRILEDGAPQQITNFAPTDAPITMVVLMEFSRIGYGYFALTAKYWSYDLLNHLKKDDWLALVTFDLRTHIEVDFTQDKYEVQQAISSLFFPGFSEANLFDALFEMLDRLQDVKGKKSILILGTGLDTFSKHTLDQTLKRLKQTDVTIFGIGVTEELVNYLDATGQLGTTGRMDFLQANNQLSSFARMTGGYAWFPRFDGEIPGIFNSVAGFLRNQYTIGYVPTNANHDGKFRKIKVEVVDQNGEPLKYADKKGHKKKIVVYAREGYLAPKGPIGD
jgi:VWFA-related protein